MALEFDGSNDLISVPDADMLDPTDITISAWLKPTTLSGYPGYIGHTDNNTGWFLQPDAVGHIYLQISDHYEHYIGTTYLSVGAWSYIVFTFSPNTGKAYKNGVYIESKAFPGGITACGEVLTIGGPTPGGGYFNGIIGEVSIWNRALSDGEIQNLYYRRLIPDSSTIAYWRFDEGALNLAPGGKDCADITGNGNHGTAEASMTDSDYVDGPPIQWNQGD